MWRARSGGQDLASCDRLLSNGQIGHRGQHEVDKNSGTLDGAMHMKSTKIIILIQATSESTLGAA